MFEYFHDIFEDTLEHIFDTCLESMKLGEVDKFRLPRVWIRREVPVVARTIRSHPLREVFPAKIPGQLDSDFRHFSEGLQAGRSTRWSGRQSRTKSSS